MGVEGGPEVESCSYCGRQVNPTLHRRSGDKAFEVDYYRLITGQLSKMVMQDPRDESQQIEFYKLSLPRAVIACRDCIQKQEVESDLESLFSGVPGNGGEEAAG